MRSKRQKIISYDTLPFYGKLSFWLGSLNVVKNLKCGSWLDVLCGYFATLQLSQKNNKKITSFYSLDFKLSPTLKKKGLKLKEVYLAKTLPYKSKSFDNVTTINGLEHLLYDQQMVNEMYRVLKPGGRLQIVVPTWAGKPILEFLAFRLKHDQAYIEMNDHKMYYDKKTLWPMFVKAGFKPEYILIRRIKLGFSLYCRGVK